MFRHGCHHQAPGTTIGTTSSEGLDFEGGLNCIRSCPPQGDEPSIGGTLTPRRGEPTKKEAAENCTPHKPSLPGRNAHIFPPSYKPYKPSTNRPTNRARRLGNSYKPYKPLRFGVLESKPPWCTVCTVCMDSLGAVHGLYDGLYMVCIRFVWFV